AGGEGILRLLQHAALGADRALSFLESALPDCLRLAIHFVSSGERRSYSGTPAIRSAKIVSAPPQPRHAAAHRTRADPSRRSCAAICRRAPDPSPLRDRG